ncbi:hypothetical protein V4F39_17140 [Aquincola sp. MAHUQ-54]|uniref:TadE-like protein n=1 Tax=Aquincola agrisoli TaxID=3119538 RepID=A0AAW9Q6K6_9BURK
MRTSKRTTTARRRVTCVARQGRWQRGQAYVELIVMSLAVVPLFMLMPMIAKYQDISHAAQMASRYVAFEAMNNHPGSTGWRSEAALAADVRRRFFGESSAPIKTGDTAGEFDAHRNLFWRAPGGAPLITRFDDVTVQTANAGSQDGTPYLLHSAMGLRAHGIHSGTVIVALANLPAGIRSLEPFDRIDLSIVRRTSLVPDAWAATSPAQAESRFGGLALVNELFDSGIGDVVGFGITASELLGRVAPPAFGQLDEWRDVVPADRLKPAE